MMKKATYLSLLVFIFMSCGNDHLKEKISLLEGYWEIQSVTLPNGTARDFTINSTVDFIELNGENGVRKKVQPQLDGSFIASKGAEKFEAVYKNDSLFLQYNTPYANWTEVVLEIKSNSFTIKNSDDKIYTYKRLENKSLIPKK